MTDIKLNDEQLRTIIAKAVLDSLTPERREALISTAVKNLLDKPISGRYDQKSNLQTAFDDATREVARKLATEMVSSDPIIKEKIKALFVDAWTKFTNDENYSKLVEKVSHALEKGLTGDRY